MNLTYNISREEASELLNISTRTLDRYIRRWKLSYRKVANRVLLAREELDKLKDEIDVINDVMHYSEVISNNWSSFSNDEDWNTQSHHLATSDIEDIKQVINSSFQGFLNVLKDKDTIINDKNNQIISMQWRIVELESRIRNSVALPDYTKEKENILLEKEKLSMENSLITEELKKQRMKNIAYVIALLLCIVLVIFAFMIR